METVVDATNINWYNIVVPEDVSEVQFNIPVDIITTLGSYYFATNQDLVGYFAYYFIVKTFVPTLYWQIQWDMAIFYVITIILSIPLYRILVPPCSCLGESSSGVTKRTGFEETDILGELDIVR